MKIGLSLGGGGSRGYAHIGAIRALTEARIPIDMINGSSMGAIVGGAYALYMDLEEIINLVQKVVSNVNVRYFNIFRHSAETRPFLRDWLTNAICDLSTLRSYIISHKRNTRALELIFGEHKFHEVQIPFSCIAVNVLSGEIVIIKEGKLVDGILASISIPGIFPPVQRGEHLLFDGAIIADIPVRELRQQGAEFIIAIKLVAPRVFDYKNGFDILNYIEALQKEKLSDWELEDADFQIRIDIPDFDILAFDNYETAIAHGYETVKQALPALERRLVQFNV